MSVTIVNDNYSGVDFPLGGVRRSCNLGFVLVRLCELLFRGLFCRFKYFLCGIILVNIVVCRLREEAVGDCLRFVSGHHIVGVGELRHANIRLVS